MLRRVAKLTRGTLRRTSVNLRQVGCDMPRSMTRQRLIDVGVQRFYRDGFRNVGIDQILNEVGISKTAFYKHFESKEDLMLAALEDNNCRVQEMFRGLMRELGGASAVGQLNALMDVVERIVDTEGFQGCIFVNAAIEFPLAHEPAHLAAARSKQAIEELVCEIAMQAGAADPRILAKELCLIMEGAYVTRHVTGDKQAAEIARRVAQLVIADRCAPCALATAN
jgi:AcrR family transcriptional regulator